MATIETRSEIITLVVAMFDAAPGTQVLSDLVAASDAGSSNKQIATHLATTAEFNSIYPTFLANSEFVSKFVNNMVGNLVSESEKNTIKAALTAEMNAGATRVDVVLSAVAALKAVPTTDAVWGKASAAFANKVEVAKFHTVEEQQPTTTLSGLQNVLAGVDNTEASVTKAKEAISEGANVGEIYALTVGEDNITASGGNDIFNANVIQDNVGGIVNSLENIDVLNGGAGNDTLNVTLGEAVTASPVLQSIENVNVRFADASANLNLGNATGTTAVTVNSSSTAGTISNFGAIASLGVRNQLQNVTVTGNTATSLALNLDGFGKTGAANTLTLDNVPTTLNVTANNSTAVVAGAGKIATLTVAATGANALDLSASAGTITTATITGAGSANLTTTGTLTALTTLSGADNTGGITASVDDTATTVTTGAGKDSITYVGAGLAAKAVVNLGAGDDTLTIGGAAAIGAKADGGAGNDTLKVANGAWLAAGSDKVYSGFETLDVAGGTGTYNMENLSGLTAVTSSAALTGAVSITNAVAATTVSIGASTGTHAISYALKDATGKDDALSLAVTGKTATTVHSFTANDIETFNISATSTGTPLPATHVISALAGNAVTELNVTGNAGLVLAAAPATLTVVNASGMTGPAGLTIDVSKAAQSVEFIGGAGKDTFTASGFGDTINAGKGGDDVTLDASHSASDTLIFAAGDSVLNAKANGHDVVANFGTAAGGTLDVIDLGAFGFSGQQSSALANKGAIGNSVVDGTVLTQADFFLSGSVDRGVAIGTNNGDTYVFVDVNKDGNFNAADDLIIQLQGVTDVTLANFGF